MHMTKIVLHYIDNAYMLLRINKTYLPIYDSILFYCCFKATVTVITHTSAYHKARINTNGSLSYCYNFKNTIVFQSYMKPSSFPATSNMLIRQEYNISGIYRYNKSNVVSKRQIVNPAHSSRAGEKLVAP